VSPTTEKALRDAMARLLAGRARRTDGKLTKENLYREAEVSRATMNRAHDVLTAWNHTVAGRAGLSPTRAASDELAQLRTKLNRKTEEYAELQKRLAAAATTIAALHHDNSALHEELARHQSSKIVPIA
jgi:chromosome segregation ATPase